MLWENALAGAFFRSILPDHYSGGWLLAHGSPEPRLDRSPDVSPCLVLRLGPVALKVLVQVPVPVLFLF